MSKSRISVLTAIPLTLALGAGLSAGGLLPEALQPVPSAMAQANPCAPGNPCAPARKAKAAANPCAPAAAATASSAVAGPFQAAGAKPAPFGDAVGAGLKNYTRPATFVGTSGQPEGADIYKRIKDMGFKTVVNLRTEKEGAVEEAAQVKAAGLGYVSIPVSTPAPTLPQVAEFAKLMGDAGNYPVLVHCHTANRVGAMWALYRAQSGVPAAVALEEGLAVGLEGKRETTVREMLGVK